MSKPRVLIVSPALADANNGNWHTAARWARFLAPLAEVLIAKRWDGSPFDALIALHARRSAQAVAGYRAAHPTHPLALVLTGTEVFRDIVVVRVGRHSLVCASLLVLLEPEALERLPAALRPRARVILQSASRVLRRDQARTQIDLVAVGHLRDEKDPLTLMAGARLLPADGPIRIVHIGAALDPALGQAARRTMTDCARYRWLGALPRAAARRWIARGRALVHMSRMEGGAHVVIEAVRSRVPVLASRIDGNVGLLGSDYQGYFETGNPVELAGLMQRFAGDPAFAARLAAQCALREPLFAPPAERAAVRRMLGEMFGASP